MLSLIETWAFGNKALSHLLLRK